MLSREVKAGTEVRVSIVKKNFIKGVSRKEKEMEVLEKALD